MHDRIHNEEKKKSRRRREKKEIEKEGCNSCLGHEEGMNHRKISTRPELRLPLQESVGSIHALAIYLPRDK